MSRRRWSAFAASVLLAVPCAADLTDEPGASLARLHLDRAFGQAGEVTSAIGTYRRIDRFEYVAVDSQRRVLAAGRLAAGPNRIVSAIARFHADGSIDRSFGEGGVALLRVKGRLSGMLVDGHDRVVVTGSFKGARNRVFAAARFTQRGRIDRGFAGDGYFETYPALDRGWSMPRLVPSDDGIVALVRTTTGGFAVARLDGEGAVPEDWQGPVGLVPVAGTRIENLLADAEGRVLVCDRDGVTRLRADGLPDHDFGVGGTLQDTRGLPLRVADGAIALDRQGRIVARQSEFLDTSLARFLPDGTPDPSFSGDGRARWATGAPSAAAPRDVRLTVGGGDAERWVFTSEPRMDGDSEFFDVGLFVAAIDPSAPGSVASALLDVYASSLYEGAVQERAADTAVAPDGSAAYVAGWRWKEGPRGRRTYTPTLRKVDLTAPTPVPLPDLQVEWVNEPVVTPPAPGSNFGTFQAVLRVTNAGPGPVEFAEVRLYTSDDEKFDGPRDGYSHTWRTDAALAPGESLVHIFTGAEFRRDLLPGQRVLAVVNPDGAFMETDFSNNVRAAAPLE